MQVVLSKHKNNITSIIQWLILSKLDVHTCFWIHPCIWIYYNIEDIAVVLWSQQITNIFFIALHGHSDWPFLGNNSPHTCILALFLGLGGRSYINVDLVEWSLLKKKVYNFEVNRKCNLSLTEVRQRSRAKHNCHNNIIDHLISQVFITKLWT